MQFLYNDGFLRNWYGPLALTEYQFSVYTNLKILITLSPLLHYNAVL
jgi:hypothetical protein